MAQRPAFDPRAEIKLILTVPDSFRCVLQIQTMIASGSHHAGLPRAVWMEALFLDPSSAGRRETASEVKSRVSPLKNKRNKL